MLFFVFTKPTNAIAFSSTQEDILTQYGNFGRLALPIGALTYSLLIGDNQGAKQMTYLFFSSSFASEALKRITRERRPDGSDRMSFPSGHAMAAFSASAYITRRYGLFAGALPTVAAIGVATSRVVAKRHYFHDVFASYLIATAMSFVFVTKANGPNIGVEYDNKKKAISFSYQDDF